MGFTQKSEKAKSWLQGLLRPLADQNIRSIRLSHLPYMLMFPLAPLFANMQGGVLSRQPGLMGLDAMSLMGAAYCLGAGLLFAFARLEGLKRYARALSLISAALYAAWLAMPPGMTGLIFGLLFTFVFGGCAGIAAFTFSYALNKAERILGAGLISIFCMLWQLDFSHQLISGLFPQAYLTALVLGTVICLNLYRGEDYQSVRENSQTRLNLPIVLMLLFFFAHKTVEVFYTYLPGASTMEALRANAWTGILVFFLSLFLYFRVRFSIWHMCNLFFMGMVVAVFLLSFGQSPFALAASRFAHGFEQMGFIASYCLLGLVMSQHAGFRLFKWIIFFALNLAMLIYMVPGLIAAGNPEALPGAAIAVAAGSFVLFILLTPLYTQKLFGLGALEQPANPIVLGESSAEALEVVLDEKGLTPREQEILSLLLDGLLIKECADRLDISVDTVKFHTKNIYRKLGINSRSQLYSAVKKL